MTDNEWKPISTAPRDGTRIELLSSNGKSDYGSWYNYFDGHIENETGEFSTDNGEGAYVYWRPAKEGT